MVASRLEGGTVSLNEDESAVGETARLLFLWPIKPVTFEGLAAV